MRLTRWDGLSGDPFFYAVRGEVRDLDGDDGINSRAAGGFCDSGICYGTNWENLTATTVNLFRRPQDEYADQVRVRIWERTFQVYLPLVVKNL